MLIKILMIVLFFAVTVLVGVLASRKARGVDGFVLGGRSVGPWLPSCTVCTGKRPPRPPWGSASPPVWASP